MIKKTDKPADAKPSMTEQVKTAAEQPAETWNPHWGVSRRLLEMRRKLRGTKLHKTFEMQRSFEAFSIHSLADEIEAVACDCGLISSFRVTKWEKVGNRTVVEGMVTFEDVDHGDVREYPGVGEAIDNDDKGLHKADSDARKVALINSLNLGIGNDKEAESGKAEGDAMSGSMGGSPQQAPAPKVAADFIRPATNGHAAPTPNKMYTLQQAGVKARSVLGSGMLSNCWAIIQNVGTVTALDEFVEANKEMLTEFSTDDPTIGGQLHKLTSARRESLAAKGLI